MDLKLSTLVDEDIFKVFQSKILIKIKRKFRNLYDSNNTVP